MIKLLFPVLALLLHAGTAHAQETVFIPNCGGDNDTSRIASLITRIGGNTGTIRLPYKDGTRCAVASITFPDNVTLDNGDGTGLFLRTGAVVTILGPIVNPIGKPLFFGSGTTNFTGNTHIGTAGQALLSGGDGTTLWGSSGGGGGGGGSVLTVFGRDGTVTAQTGDYTWQQINKASSDIADITIRDASRLSNGITGSGLIVLQNSPTLVAPALGVASATSVNKVVITPPTTSATFTIADGKTLSVANTLAFSGTDAKSLTLTGSLSVGADTSITGGGGLALAGFTGTLPTTGTFALGANTLSVTSSNNTNTSLHSHAVSSSSNPGAAASLLASNTSGFLQLTRLGIGTTPTQPLEVSGNVFINSPTANLFMRDTNTGWQAPNTTIITPQPNNSIRSAPYTSGVDGWSVGANGDAEFNNVRVRGEIAASVFQVSEITATAGTFGVFKSASTLVFDTVSPGIGNSDTFDADNSDIGGTLFAIGDRLRFKGFTGSGIADIWYTVDTVTNNGASATYTATHQFGSTGVTLQAGMAIIDYGPAGSAFITLSADGTVGSSPNITMASHAGSPWSTFTPLLRIGNLNGICGYATDVYGFCTGQYGVAGQSWLSVDQTNGVRIGNNLNVLTQVDTAGNASFTGNITAAGGTIGGWAINSTSISSGPVKLASSLDIVDNESHLWIGKQASNGIAGLDARDTANRYIQILANNGSLGPYMLAFDNTRTRVVIGELNVAFTGTTDGASNSIGMKVWDSSGNRLVEFSDVRNAIGGWTIGTSRISAGSSTTTVGIDATVTGGDDVRFFAGDATPSSAPFRVTEAGALTATNANITGAINATSGTFAGSLSAAIGTFAGSLSAATGSFAGSLSAATGSFTGDLTGSNMALTGKLTMSGASSAIAIGTTPPTSASVGTGLWLDRTGLYGLASSVQQVKLDAVTGAITAGAGNVVLDVDGIRLAAGTGNANKLRWLETANVIFNQNAQSSSSTVSATMTAHQRSGVTTGATNITLVSNNDINGEANLQIYKFDNGHATLANRAVIQMGGMDGTLGGVIISNFTTQVMPTASAALEISTTTGAFLPSRMTTTQRDALTAANGMVIYNTTTDKLQVRAAGAWVDLH